LFVISTLITKELNLNEMMFLPATRCNCKVDGSRTGRADIGRGPSPIASKNEKNVPSPKYETNESNERMTEMKEMKETKQCRNVKIIPDYPKNYRLM
jgi:hypothetical protein